MNYLTSVMEYFSSNRRIEDILIDLTYKVDDLQKSIEGLSYGEPLISPRSSNHSDGSNLGVFVKQRINNNTQLQYVTGNTAAYNTRKQMYEEINMDKIYDDKDPEPNLKKLKINEQLIRNGCELCTISDNSLIVNCDCDKVVRIIGEVLKE
ncbi:PxORF54 peptide [Plutella xylostella granulovirus]|uniref:ORF52 protein n=1 Tax=Plutella xylostella granulovirus TaxID=98383 RepID=Q9DVX9_9BBAC|nr:PxORF54 peptide [Plutella xylostella granulovirus]AAG27352.1 PxORF54 peptide [Plutella xylostella granulovirus]AMQ35664.1 PxGV-Corf52 protein [Plutella xylostella granulovirus]AMQ35781.1 PxGV-Korf52 protein [Plutella xylostella granulovirus]AMQ35898.1 PxGV-Morf52 protein [Plutella xylostella granulovirus]AMQ36015.1 PxGV-Torf52 protein [Plutella xylostella granulovirus]